jgi:hypothetical protein
MFSTSIDTIDKATESNTMYKGDFKKTQKTLDWVTIERWGKPIDVELSIPCSTVLVKNFAEEILPIEKKLEFRFVRNNIPPDVPVSIGAGEEAPLNVSREMDTTENIRSEGRIRNLGTTGRGEESKQVTKYMYPNSNPVTPKSNKWGV